MGIVNGDNVFQVNHKEEDLELSDDEDVDVFEDLESVFDCDDVSLSDMFDDDCMSLSDMFESEISEADFDSDSCSLEDLF